MSIRADVLAWIVAHPQPHLYTEIAAALPALDPRQVSNALDKLARRGTIRCGWRDAQRRWYSDLTYQAPRPAP